MALHVDLGSDPGDTADFYPAILAGVAGLGTEAEGRDVKATEFGGVVQSGAEADDGFDDAGFCGELRDCVWSDSAVAANPGRAEGARGDFVGGEGGAGESDGGSEGGRETSAESGSAETDRGECDRCGSGAGDDLAGDRRVGRAVRAGDAGG